MSKKSGTEWWNCSVLFREISMLWLSSNSFMWSMLSFFYPMLPFNPPGNIKRPRAFRWFLADQKKEFDKKGLNTSILPFLRVIVLEIFFFLSYKSCAGQPKLKKLLSWNAKQLYWSHTRHGSSPINLVHIFWTSCLKNTSQLLLLLILPISLAKLIEWIWLLA